MPREWLIQHRAGTLAQWAAAETAGPVLLAGERGYISDLNADVVGDGVTKVASLPKVGSGTYAEILDPAATYTYDGNGNIATEVIGGVTTTFTYNADSTVATATRNGVTRTYSYTSGRLTGIA